MPDKDINIHVRAKDTAQTKQQIDSIGKSTQQLGQKTADGQKQAAGATEKTTQKIGAMDRAVTTIKSNILGMISGFLGIRVVMEVINTLITKLEKVQSIQSEIHNKSLTAMEVGQAISIQTNTPGQQEYWTKQALKIQKAGGIKDIGTVQGMMIQGDITYGSEGGI